jgi:hypothetical protein
MRPLRAIKKVLRAIPGYKANAIPVGASLLAMVVNDNARNLTPRGVLQLIASKLAPTKGGVHIAVPLKKKTADESAVFFIEQREDQKSSSRHTS